MANKTFGLALGAGAMRGMCHIGVLEVLEQHNLVPDMISGTSMGAVIGGLYAAGVSIDHSGTSATTSSAVKRYTLIKVILLTRYAQVMRFPVCLLLLRWAICCLWTED